MKRPPPRRWWAPVLVGLLAALAWAFAVGGIEASRLAAGESEVGAAAIRRTLLPTPPEIWAAAVSDRANLLAAAGNTLWAAFLGFVSAGVGGYLIALGLSLARVLKEAFYPWILVIQMTPVIVMAPIIALWIRQPPLAPVIFVTFLLGFFPVVANALHGFATVPRRLEELFAICRARPWQTFWYLRVPYSLPAWFTGLKIAATLAPVGALFADLFVGSAEGSPGLGFQILAYRNSLNSPGLFAAAILACLMGFFFVGLVRLIRVLCLRRWSDSMLSKAP
jgi:NitT/TauT family transport system permease protein